MRSLPSALATELGTAGHGDLFTVLELGTATPIYRTSRPGGITFDSKTYLFDAFTFGEVGAGVVNTSPSIPLSIQNVRDPGTGAARPWSTFLAGTESLNGISVTVRILMVSQLSDTTAQIEEEGWTATTPRLSGDTLTLDLAPPLDLGRLVIPEPMLRSPRCRFGYKDEFCRSTSPLTACDKLTGNCAVRHSPQKVRISQMPFSPPRLRRQA